MQQYYLSAHLRHCLIDDGVVLLNMATEKYLALPPGARQIFELATACINDSAHEALFSAEQHESIQALVREGVLTPDPSKGVSAMPATRLVSDSLLATSQLGPPEQIRLRDLLTFTASALRAMYELKFSRLDKTARRIQRKRQKVEDSWSAADHPSIRELFLRFRRMRVWLYGSSGRCLLDSLVLTEFLLRNNVPASVVLGVSTKPFSAHAWVQLRDLALNDRAERINFYTPIMVI